MKLACNQSTFSTKLQEVARIAAHNPSSSNYRTVLLQANDGHLTLRCTETHGVAKDIITRIPASIDKGGSALVDAALMTELAQSYPKDAVVNAQMVRGRPYLTLLCGDSVANLHLNKNPLPNPLPVENPIVLTLDSQKLRFCLASVVHAAGHDENNPALRGVHVILDDFGITTAATDGYRMSIAQQSDGTAPGDDHRFNVPHDTAREMTRILAQAKPTVQLKLATDLSRMMLTAVSENDVVTELSSGLLQGDFPDPLKLIPDSYATRAVLSPSNAAAAAKIADQFTNTGSPILMYIHPGTDADGNPGPMFTVSAKEHETGSTLHTFPLQELDGKPSRIALNPKFVLDALQPLRSAEKAAIELPADSGPAVFRNYDQDTLTSLSLIMPMYIDWSMLTDPPAMAGHAPAPEPAPPPAPAAPAPQDQPPPNDARAEPEPDPQTGNPPEASTDPKPARQRRPRKKAAADAE